MATITRRGETVHTSGNLPAIGILAPEATFVTTDLEELTLTELSGQHILLNIFPSIDTPTCAKSVRRFNQAAAGCHNTKVLCVSADLPFAQRRFCATEGLDSVISVSTFRNRKFGLAYGVEMVDGPLRGLLARAVVVISDKGRIAYVEQVPEIGHEPDYDVALGSIEALDAVE